MMVFLPPAPSAYVAYRDTESSCPAADIAVTSLSVKIAKHSTSDHYVITGNVQNVGHHAQEPNVQQRVELVRNGKVLVPQTLPPLDADVVYPVSFSLDRPATERGKPLVLTLRYVPIGKASHSDDCSNANDSLTKTF